MSHHHTLLQTDLVDSTRLAGLLGDEAWAVLSESHDQVARDLLPAWRGREIDKSDGFLLLFTSVDDAAGYAIAYHRTLAALDKRLQARAGIHVGSLVSREISAAHIERGAKPLEVEGVAKPLTARVMAVAAGGQTLLSAAACHALGSSPWQVRSHGHWRMKGFAEPFELHEVGEWGAAFKPPVDSAKGYRVVQRGELWLPKRELRHSLPAERNSFVGRSESLQDLARRFDADARLVTVVGMGGIGKTRFAQRFGRTWLGDYPGGVWFCDLAQATSLEGVLHAVAQGLDVPLSNADPITQLGNAITGREACLVILDNFEQVVRHAEATLGRWLDRASEAKFLVTSRESLGITGEEVFRLETLDLHEAATLFVQRSSAAKGEFVPAIEDMAAIDPLVKLLDGLPLAVELAAARTRVMSPRALLARMSERFKLLASGTGRSERHATLRATFDWSWDLMSAPEKLALAQLSVFEGGFTLDGASAVFDFSSIGSDVPWATDVVQTLVEKSLVRTSKSGRFDLLVSVQAYAAEKLALSEPDAQTETAELSTAARHWIWFAGLDQRAVVAEGCVELENVVAACRRATLANRPSAAVEVLKNAWAALRLRGPHNVAMQLATGVEGMRRVDAIGMAAVHWVAGSALQAMGFAAQARIRINAGLAGLCLALDQSKQAWQTSQARLLCARGYLCVAAGQSADANRDLSAALGLAERLNASILSCEILNGLATVASFSGKPVEARSLYQQSLVIARECRSLQWEGGVLGNLGNLYFEQGDLIQAEEHHHRALNLALECGDRRWEGNSRCNLGLVYHELHRSLEARREFEESMSIARQLGYPRLEATVACNLGIALEAIHDLSSARDKYSDALRIATELGEPRLAGQFSGYLGLVLAKIGLVDEGRQKIEDGENWSRQVNDYVNLAMLLLKSAEVEYIAGNVNAAKIKFFHGKNMISETRLQSNGDIERALTAVSTLIAG